HFATSFVRSWPSLSLLLSCIRLCVSRQWNVVSENTGRHTLDIAGLIIVDGAESDTRLSGLSRRHGHHRPRPIRLDPTNDLLSTICMTPCWQRST
ncbi:hypothetical protein C8Q76DRAFT_824655, partial [Earliella scabrosa]